MLVVIVISEKQRNVPKFSYKLGATPNQSAKGLSSDYIIRALVWLFGQSVATSRPDDPPPPLFPSILYSLYSLGLAFRISVGGMGCRNHLFCPRASYCAWPTGTAAEDPRKSVGRTHPPTVSGLSRPSRKMAPPTPVTGPALGSLFVFPGLCVSWFPCCVCWLPCSNVWNSLLLFLVSTVFNLLAPFPCPCVLFPCLG